MIEVDGLVKRYGGFTALHGISFSVRGGSVTAFLGLNGAGKSTTLRVLSCFLPPTSGTVTVAGHDAVRASEAVRREIGYLPESVPLHPEMKVGEYLRFRARLKGVPATELSAAVSQAASRCKVDDVVGAPIGSLSKGYRQRVGIADAIVHRPKVLILDEPTSGLDPAQRLQVRALVKELGSDRTVFVSTHIIPEVEATCDDIVVIHRGRIVASGPLASLARGGGVRLIFEKAALPNAETRDDGRNVAVFATPELASSAAAAVVKQGGTLHELAPIREGLEAAFSRLTTGADA